MVTIIHVCHILSHNTVSMAYISIIFSKLRIEEEKVMVMHQITVLFCFVIFVISVGVSATPSKWTVIQFLYFEILLLSLLFSLFVMRQRFRCLESFMP